MLGLGFFPLNWYFVLRWPVLDFGHCVYWILKIENVKKKP
jgi:hypothetical protein